MERTKAHAWISGSSGKRIITQGASTVNVQRLLRHEDLSTTMGYLDPDALEIENLVRNL